MSTYSRAVIIVGLSESDFPSPMCPNLLKHITTMEQVDVVGEEQPAYGILVGSAEDGIHRYDYMELCGMIEAAQMEFTSATSLKGKIYFGIQSW